MTRKDGISLKWEGDWNRQALASFEPQKEFLIPWPWTVWMCVCVCVCVWERWRVENHRQKKCVTFCVTRGSWLVCGHFFDAWALLLGWILFSLHTFVGHFCGYLLNRNDKYRKIFFGKTKGCFCYKMQYFSIIFKSCTDTYKGLKWD